MPNRQLVRPTNGLDNLAPLIIYTTNPFHLILRPPYGQSWLRCYGAFKSRKPHHPDITPWINQTTPTQGVEINLVDVTIVARKATTLQAALGQ